LAIRKKRLAAIGTILLASALLAVLALLSVRNTKISAQNFPPVVARIEGDDLEVVTSAPSGVERDAAPTVVASGSEVTVRSGHALLMLNTGGEVSVCGPARFKLIESSGTVTLALDYGRVHPSLENSEGFTIYTPAIVATPIAIAGGRRDITLGLQESGEMCMLTARGAMRVEPQFSDQSVIVPQGGTVSLAGGQIESLQADPAACSCDFPRARLQTPQSLAPAEHSQPPVEISALAPPIAPQRRKTENLPPPSASGSEPVYTVLMPPLSFNAASPEPPPAPAAETILLVREVRLRPAAEFRGHVSLAPEPAVPPAAPPVALAPPEALPPTEKPTLLDRVRIFFRRLASTAEPPCAGAGCSG
jgi:hypothetical protein